MDDKIKNDKKYFILLLILWYENSILIVRDFKRMKVIHIVDIKCLNHMRNWSLFEDKIIT